jgi:phytoene dehydrogenase-like protein
MKRKVVVIGGGVAGLSTGIYGQMNGFDMEIIEMSSITGGQCTAWVRKGYRFDYCLHWLVGTAKGVFYDLWRETNVINSDTVIHDHDVHTAILDDNGNEFIIYTNIERWKKYLMELAPEDAAGIKRMCGDMKKASYFEPLVKITKISDLFEYSRGFIKMSPFLPLVVKYGKKNCSEYFNDLNLKNDKLKGFLDSMFGDRNFSALAFIMMLGWFDQKNAGYLLGGSLPFAKRMEEKYSSLGGKLRTGKRVSKIIVENDAAKGVILTDGTVINADYVVSAADGYSTIFDMLEGKYISMEIQNAYDTWELFTPLVQVSFGIDMEVKSDYPSQSIIAKGKHIGSTELKSGYSLMNYSFDPTMAPEGKTVIVMRFESPWDNWKDLKDNDYKAEKEKIKTDAIALLELHFPGVTKHIEIADVATPSTTVKYTGVWKGSYEGFLPAANNITKTLKNTLPGLSNFYMAGQWLFPGGGLPPSVMSGKTAIRKICKNEKRAFVVN